VLTSERGIFTRPIGLSLSPSELLWITVSQISTQHAEKIKPEDEHEETSDDFFLYGFSFSGKTFYREKGQFLRKYGLPLDKSIVGHANWS